MKFIYLNGFIHQRIYISVHSILLFIYFCQPAHWTVHHYHQGCPGDGCHFLYLPTVAKMATHTQLIGLEHVKSEGSMSLSRVSCLAVEASALLTGIRKCSGEAGSSVMLNLCSYQGQRYLAALRIGCPVLKLSHSAIPTASSLEKDASICLIGGPYHHPYPLSMEVM